MGASEFLVRIAEARRFLEGDVLQPGTTEGAASGLHHRGSIGVPLMPADTVQLLEQSLPAGERGRVLLSRRHGPIGRHRLLCRSIHLESRQGLAGEASLAVVRHCQWDISRHTLTESGMTFGASLLAYKGKGGLLQTA